MRPVRFIPGALAGACLVLSFFSWPLRAEIPAVRFDPTAENVVYLTPFVDLLRDSEGRLTFDDVRTSPGFEPAGDGAPPNFGFSRDVVWLRFRVSGPDAARAFIELDNPLLAHADFYFEKENGTFGLHRTGRNPEADPPAVATRTFVLPLDLSPRPRTIFVRVESGTALRLSLKLWSPSAFHAANRWGYALLGTYLGIALVMAIYNFILFLSIRDRSYLYYTLYIVSFGVFVFSSRGLLLDLFRVPEMANLAGQLGTTLSILFAAKFGQNFLLTAKVPWIHRVFNGALYLAGALAAGAFLIPLQEFWIFTNFFTASFSAFTLVATFIRWRMGYRPAGYFLLAWSLFLVGVTLFSLFSLGLLPESFLVAEGLLIGSAVELVLLSFALGYRFNVLHEEKEAAQAETIRQRERMLASVRRFVPEEFLQSLKRQDITEIAAGDSTRREMAVLFTDIRGFTSFSESREPDRIFAFLNDYLSAMDPAIHGQEGFIDKFIGDAIMALFPPGDRALRAGLAMLEALKVYNARPDTESEVRIGIGIHQGELTLGTLGSQRRIDTTVIGDTVNLASRMEGLTKKIGLPLLISDSYRRILPADHGFLIREVAMVRVRGKNAPILIHEVFDHEAQDAREAKRVALPAYNEGLYHFRQGNHARAGDLFARFLEAVPGDPVARKYAEYCARKKPKVESQEPDGPAES